MASSARAVTAAPWCASSLSLEKRRSNFSSPGWLQGSGLKSSNPLRIRLQARENGATLRNNSSKSVTHRVLGSVWQDNSARVDVDVPLEEAWLIWEDRESIPNFMPWIHSVKVSEENPELSTWNLRYEAFNQKLSFSWVSKNLKPINYQKIHWRAVDGLANKGAVRFFRKGKDACSVELTISYEVPEILSPFAAALAPLVEQIIMGDMKRFAEYAKKRQLSNS